MDENKNIRKMKKPELEAKIQSLITVTDGLKKDLDLEKSKHALLLNSFADETPNDIIDEFINLLSLRESSSFRLVFFETDFFLQKIKFSMGENSSDFGLLDDQVIDQIREKNNLVIQDTSKIHTIKFFQGSTYPRSIMVFPIKSNSKNIGIVWVGDLNYQAFSKQDFQHFDTLVMQYQDALAISVKKIKMDQERKLFSVIYQDEENPILVFNEEKNIAFANRSAISAFNIVENEKNNGYSCDQKFSSLLEKRETYEPVLLSFNNREYEVVQIKISQGLHSQIFCYKFIDKSGDIAVREYLETIVSAVLQSFRSPMIEIKGLAALITAHGNLSGKQTEFLTQLNHQISELDSSVTQLIDINKITQGSFLTLEKFIIEEALLNLIELLNPMAEQKQISIKINISDKGVTIVSDKAFFKHALLNVIDHAIKKTRIGGMIEIDHSVEGNSQFFSITDTGKGISQLDINKMMDEDRIDPNMGEIELAQRIMRILNGDLKLESHLGNGTKTTLQFPEIG